MDTKLLTEDQKDLQVLANTLALILDEEKEPASVALEALRERARKRKMSGSTLKNLFINLSEHEQRVQGALYRSNDTTETLSDRHRHLQSEYALIQEEYERLQRCSNIHESQALLRRVGLCIALFAGILVGIAGSHLVDSLTAPPHIDPTLCLR